MKKDCRYYHLSGKKLTDKLEPYGFFERVSDDELKYWYPISNSPPIFPISNVKESCFATTIEGALFGVYSDYDKPGKMFVYCTNEKPDVDLTDETVQDFGIIQEVRYRRPVNIKQKCVIDVDKNIIDEIKKCHFETEEGEVFFNDDCGRIVKNKLRRKLKKETDCYDN